MIWTRPESRCGGRSWVAVTGSATQAIPASPSQYSNRPSWSGRSSRLSGTGRQPGNSGVCRAVRRRAIAAMSDSTAAVLLDMSASGVRSGSRAMSVAASPRDRHAVRRDLRRVVCRPAPRDTMARSEVYRLGSRGNALRRQFPPSSRSVGGFTPIGSPEHRNDGKIAWAGGAPVRSHGDEGRRCVSGNCRLYAETRSAIARMRCMSRSTGFSTSLPSITTRPVSASSKVRMMRRARSICAASGVNTALRAGICFG